MPGVSESEGEPEQPIFLVGTQKITLPHSKQFTEIPFEVFV
jgi:hypothetical protein